jgi:hypothetical protein
MESLVMLKVTLLAIGTVALMSAIPASAQQKTAPGQRMQDKGSVKGTTGASGYAPGQKMQKKGSVKGTTGASGYAPGHADSTKK